MSNTNKLNGPSQNWLQRMAELEDSCRSVSAAGLASDFGMLLIPPHGETQQVFGRLIELARRKCRLTVEQLAEKADVDLVEIVDIETKLDVVPEARTVFQLASVLKLPSARLMEVTGLAIPRPEIRSAALKFAAHSKSTANLTQEERDALEEFVKVLISNSDGE